MKLKPRDEHMSETRVGSVIDNKYVLLEEVGAGGMGLVYKAQQQGLERIVAIKILEPTLVSDEESLARFEREARSISLLNHTHIASFFSYGIHEGRAPYIAMEFLEGSNLKSLIQETDNGMEWQRALKICIEICDAMEYAHQQGVVHRDLKPNNIILLSTPQPDWVKVVDFGLAKLADLTESGKQRLTRTGELLGSVDYLSPEQCLGRQTDQRSDIYSLACILFEMLTGRTPFESDNPIGQIHKHTNEESPLITTVSQKLFPPGLELLIKKSLSKDPAERYQNMAALATDLKIILEGRGGELAPSLSKYALKTSRKAKSVSPALLVAATAAIAICALAAGAGWLYFTDAGTLLREKSSLESTPTFKNRVDWLVTADKLELEGKSQTAQLIRNEVMRPYEARNESEFGVAKTYLALATEYARVGNKTLEGKAGWMALQEMFKVSKPPADGSISDKRIRAYLETMENAALVANRSPEKFNKTDAGMLQKLSRPIMNVPGQFALNLVDLLERVVDDARMPANDGTVECYRLRAQNLSARHPVDVERVHKAVLKASKEAMRLYGQTSAAPAQAWAETARYLALDGQRKMALQYLKKAESYLKLVEPKTNNTTLNDCMIEALNGYLNLNMHAEAQRVAQELKTYACAQTQECSSCAKSHDILWSVIRQSDPLAAIPYLVLSAKLYRSFDYTDNDDPLREYQRVIDNLKVIYREPKLTPALKDSIRNEFKQAKGFYEKHDLDSSAIPI